MRLILTQLFFIFTLHLTVAQNLGLNLKVGETYFQNSNANITIKQEMQGQSIEFDMTVSAKMGFLVKDKSDDLYTMETRYHQLAMKTSSAYANMDYSSEKGRDSTDLMSNILYKMLDHSFEVKMKSNGSVEEITNLDDIFSDIFDNTPDVPEFQKQQIVNQLKQSYGEGAFKGNIEVVTAIFPDKEVKVNDTWNKQVSLQSSVKVQMDSEFTLKEITDDYAIISVEATSKTSDESDFEEMNGMPMKFDLNGNLTGTIRILRETGWIQQSDMHQEFSGNIEVADNPQMPGGMLIPMEMISDTKITDQ